MKILAFDSNSIVNRAYYGVRPLTTKTGIPTQAVYGFFNITYKLIEEEHPDLVLFTFDVHAPTFRHKMYADYKGTRKPMKDDLKVQMPLVKEMIRLLGYPIVELEGYEADDLLGTISRLGEKRGDDVSICTGDRDSLQLVTEHTTVILAKSSQGNTSYERMTPDLIMEQYNLTPLELIELKAIQGDSSDNIPGVPGIGEKGAAELIAAYHSLDYIYAHLDELSVKSRTLELLKKGEASARMSRTLGEICCEAPIPDLSSFFVSPMNRDELFRFFSKLELNRLIARLGLSAPVTDVSVIDAPATSTSVKDIPASRNVTWPALEVRNELPTVECLNGVSSCCIVPLWDKDEQCTGISFLVGNVLYWVTQPEESRLLSLLESSVEKIVSDSKLLHKWCMSRGRSLNHVSLDTTLGGYLLNPNGSDYSITQQLRENGLELSSVPGVELPSFALECAALPALQSDLLAALSNNHQEKLLCEIEQPLARVLASMELVGFRIESGQVKAFGAEMEDLICSISQEIFDLAGSEFNINSPKQLGVVLFETLGLPCKKKTKNGYSTSADVLEGLVPCHPIVGKILEYRKYQKLLSTYVNGLLGAVCPDGRIRSQFIQTETKTGRISSVEPNMQNIPIRSEPGSRMRAFFTAEPGNILVDADYNQIELRVLSAISGDKSMTEAFLTGEDIHTKTASQVFDVPPLFVTPLMRSQAKAVNFGIVYGISAHSLSEDIKVSHQEAKKYIDNYKATYSGIARYLEESIASAKAKGYAETLFGRRRQIPELSSDNHHVKLAGERLAMNSPIQGTAADIIKIAMIKVYERLLAEVPSAHLILQVHDELIVEAPEAEAEKVRILVAEEMERAVHLSVPFTVDAKVGHSWAEAH